MELENEVLNSRTDGVGVEPTKSVSTSIIADALTSMSQGGKM